MPESIEVITRFKNSGLPVPQSYRSGQKEYSILRVNLVHSIKRGATRVLIFNVSDEGGDHTLIFDTGSLKWELGNNYDS